MNWYRCLQLWLTAMTASASAQPVAEIQLASLDGSNGFTLNGGRVTSGRLVSGGRDLNGDGLPDFLMANPASSESQTRVNIVYGGGSYPAQLNVGSLTSGQGKTIFTSAENLRFVDMQGDFNADGVADLFLVLRNERYIAYGGPDLVTSLGLIDESNGVELVRSSGHPFSTPGIILDGFLGDFNGDSVDDIGLRGFGVLFGSQSLPAQIDVDTLGGAAGAVLTNVPRFQVGDIDGDGFADAGLSGNPTSRIYYGNDGPFDNPQITGEFFSVELTASGSQAMAGVGDINQDGFDDFAIGQRSDPANPSDWRGIVAVFFGGSQRQAGQLGLADLDGSNGFVLTTSQDNAQLGRAVAPAGDFNADGIADLLVGAPGFAANGDPDAGAAFIVYGSASGFPASLDVGDINGLNGIQLSGESFADPQKVSAGWSVHTAGDINGDDADDVIIGGSAIETAGKAYVVYGFPPEGINLSTRIDNARTVVADGDTLIYQVQVENIGTQTATSALIAVGDETSTDAGLINTTWFCEGSGGAICANVTGTGPITENATLPPGSLLNFQYEGRVSAAVGGTLEVTAAAAPSGGQVDVSPVNDQASDSDPVGVAESEFSQVFPGFCAGSFPPPPDQYEVNDSLENATPITAQINEPFESGGVLDSQFHTFHSDLDEDWLRFNAFVKTDPNTDEPVIYRLLFRVADRFNSGLAMKQLEKTGTGLLVQYFDEAGNQLEPTPLEDRFNRYIDSSQYEPAFSGRCFGPVAGEPVVESNRGINGVVPAADGVIYARILQCRNAGVDADNNGREDRNEYCIPGDDTQYEVLVTESLTTQVGVLSGLAVDSVTGEPVRRAFVVSEDFLVPTRDTGEFTAASLETNDSTAQILAEGYETLTLRYNIAQEFTTECGVISLQRASGVGAPDLAPASPGVSPTQSLEGGPIELSATVRNLGSLASPSSSLTFHASDDAVIDPSDPQIGTAPIPELAPLSETRLTATSVAPEFGADSVIFLGACAAAVAGEGNVTNNCFGFAPLVEQAVLVFADGFEGAGSSAKVPSRKVGSPVLFCNVED